MYPDQLASSEKPTDLDLHCLQSRIYPGLNMVNPFMPNVYFHPYQVDKSISVLRIVGCFFSPFLFKFLKKQL